MLHFSSSFDEYPALTTNFYKSLSQNAMSGTLLSTAGVLGTAGIEFDGALPEPVYVVPTAFASGSSTANRIGCAAWFKMSTGFSGVGSTTTSLISNDGIQRIVSLTLNNGLMTGGLDIYDTPSFNIGGNPVLKQSNVKGPAGQTLTQNAYHYIEIQLTGITGNTVTQLVAVDGIVWSTLTLDDPGSSYPYSSFGIGNSGAAAGSSVTVDDIIVWDDLQPLGFEFVGSTPLVPFGGVVLTTLFPTTDVTPVATPFSPQGGATLHACVDNKFVSFAANTEFMGITGAPVDEPSGAILQGAAVSYVGSVIPSGRIIDAVDWFYVFDDFTGGTAVKQNERFFGVGGIQDTVKVNPTVSVQVVASSQVVSANSYDSRFSSGTTPWTIATASSVSTQVVLQANNPGTGSSLSTDSRFFSVQRDVLTALPIGPQPGSYVVICCAG